MLVYMRLFRMQFLLHFFSTSVTLELASKVACKLVPISVRLRCGGLFEISCNLAALWGKWQQILHPSHAQIPLKSPLVYSGYFCRRFERDKRATRIAPKIASVNGAASRC